MATEYSGVTPLKIQNTGAIEVNAYVPEDGPDGLAATFTLGEGGPLEEVEVTLDLWVLGGGNYAGGWLVDFHRSIEAILVSPSGTESLLMYRDPELTYQHRT